MPLLTRDQAKDLLTRALSYSSADECEVNLGGSYGGNIRYARNTVTTSGVKDDMSLTVLSSFGTKRGAASVNELDDESIRTAVLRAEEVARLAPDDAEHMPLLGPQSYDESHTYSEVTAGIDPAYRAEVAAYSIDVARERGITAAGFFVDSTSFVAKMNSRGLFAYNRETGGDFSITARTEDGRGSGYATKDFNSAENFDGEAITTAAVEKAERSSEARVMKPGKYTVILEPLAAASFVGLLASSFDARRADEGRSFMSVGDGQTKLGTQIVDSRISIHSDPGNLDVPTSPWDSDGRPRVRTDWILNGVVKNLAYSRYWAQRQGVEATSGPSNLIMAGGDKSLDDLIAETDQAILVTRFWYIRSVDSQTLLYTGLTRDGTFLVEDGRIKHAVKNFRFNESPAIMLNNLVELGKAERVGGNMIPSLKVNDFTFSSLSDAV